ncbi:hypothetical protein GCM10027051_08330 [Niabella terrae]
MILKYLLYLSMVLGAPYLAAQQSANSYKLQYPALIPVLEAGHYGYCDPQGRVRITPQFDEVKFFERDYDFEVFTDNTKRSWGGNTYAWVSRNGERLRIDSTGKIVYTFQQQDFENAPPIVTVGIPPIRLPIVPIRDSLTGLWGLRDTLSSDTLLPCRYTRIWEQYYDQRHAPQYPLVLVSTAKDGLPFFVGLNGKEYIIRKKASHP